MYQRSKDGPDRSKISFVKINILKRFKSSELQRQSVIVRGSNRKCPQLFLKGAPEAVAARCANMPAAFEDELGNVFIFQNG